jgi:hypothetical protein
MKELIYIEEPNILFAYGQKCTDARDGLALLKYSALKAE